VLYRQSVWNGRTDGRMDCTGLHCIVGLGKDEAVQLCIFFLFIPSFILFFYFISYLGQGCVKIEYDSGSLNGLRGLVTRILGIFLLCKRVVCDTMLCTVCMVCMQV